MRAIAIHAESKRAAYLIGVDVYIGPRNAPLDTAGHPMGTRWESSHAHWTRYFPIVHEPAGWLSTQETREAV